MSTKDTAPESPKAAQKTARVKVLKNRLRVGNHFHAKGKIIPAMPIEEYELRKKGGEVELISVNP